MADSWDGYIHWEMTSFQISPKTKQNSRKILGTSITLSKIDTWHTDNGVTCFRIRSDQNGTPHVGYESTM